MFDVFVPISIPISNAEQTTQQRNNTTMQYYTRLCLEQEARTRMVFLVLGRFCFRFRFLRCACCLLLAASFVTRNCDTPFAIALNLES
jgi:hypothetical protein